MRGLAVVCVVLSVGCSLLFNAESGGEGESEVIDGGGEDIEDAVGVDPTGDGPEQDNDCPEVCDDCGDNLCVINCAGSDCGDVVCPPGVDCEVNCGVGACDGSVFCPSGNEACVVNCSGGASCRGAIQCGFGRCDIHCTGTQSCAQLEPIDCSDSCSCRVECAPEANNCSIVRCPAGCDVPAPEVCTRDIAGCDTCPQP